MTKKAWLIVSVLCIAILGGLIFISRSNQIDVSNVDLSTIQVGSSKNGNIGDHIAGKVDSKVILFEYGDYQCPGCGTAAPIIKQVVEKYGDKIAFVFRNFPLYNAHPNAFAAASAAEAAGLQGKFWEMHDYLYGNQNSWNTLSGQSRTDYFVAAAKSLGVNVDTFTTELTNPNIKKKVDFDVALGKKANVTGTPSFYIDGKNVGDQYFADGKIVTSTTSGAQAIWSSADAFGTLVIEPALRAHGISISNN
ncbi:MAG: thioredoxin domain-containing protein [Candidatus Saccharimonas sp.]